MSTSHKDFVKTITFKNVRLETGFEYNEEGDVSGTKTDLFLVEVTNGTISNIAPNVPHKDAVDAKNLLMLPSFKDMHVHLDKALYGLPWKAVSKKIEL